MKPCPHCHQTFRHGERNACCSGCGRVFIGQAAFDRHQRIVDNRHVCLDPAEMAGEDGRRVYEAAEKSRTSESGTFWRLAPREGQTNPWARKP